MRVAKRDAGQVRLHDLFPAARLQDSSVVAIGIRHEARRNERGDTRERRTRAGCIGAGPQCCVVKAELGFFGFDTWRSVDLHARHLPARVSLAFARIVETLDESGASFVSVTQAFNTTTSMGRLTLNVLLSFAQFEREVTSERIRDKIAASKRKGMWMGGPVPLGYRLENRKLLIDEAEAETVRLVFSRYLELRSVGALADELAVAGIRTKVRQFSNGRSVGGVEFTRGSLAQLLQNPLFIGKVRHRGNHYDGQHEAIVDPLSWEEVQQLLATNRRDRMVGARARSPSLLTGLISDPDGRPMTPVFTTKRTRQHRYYVTRLKAGEVRRTAWRVPAGDIDRAILDWTSEFLNNGALERVVSGDLPSRVNLARQTVPEQRSVLLKENVRVRLGSSGIVVTIGDETEHQVAAHYARRGNELKLVVAAEGQSEEPDPVLVRLLARANAAREAVTTETPDPIVSSYNKRHLWQLLRLNWLAPDIVTAIVEGRQPRALTGRRLLRAADVPLSWAEQRRYFGFA